ncbi:PrgI family protein [Candidatus Saccharibacteria bacterium]|nr:PrgI family protein [Candidatus Saccharibacteria bacterium]
MATYKVLQDIEAEDTFLGPLTLKQFIFGAVAIVSSYVCFLLITKGIWVMAIPLLPVIIVMGFLAFPWGRDQPTETWLLAKIRFMFKPRIRIWNQAGIQELVKITAPPPKMEYAGDDLSQTEVKSRLKALAETIDSRGWVVKNVSAQEYSRPSYGSLSNASSGSDRLVEMPTLPKTVSPLTDNGIEDMFNNAKSSEITNQINQSAKTHKEKTVDHLNDVAQNTEPPTDLWFMNEGPEVVKPGMASFTTSSTSPKSENIFLPEEFRSKNKTDDPNEQYISQSLKAKKDKPGQAFRNHKTIIPAEEQKPLAQPMTTRPDPVTIELARNNDRNIDSLARESNKAHRPPEDDEVVVSLH